MFIKKIAAPGFLIFALVLLLIAAAFSGCAPGETNHNGNGQAGPGNGEETPPDDPPEPDDPSRPEKTLQKSELSAIELEPTAYNFIFSPDGRYFAYYQASQVDLVRLAGLDGQEYILPPETSETGRSFSRGGAVWRGEKLYYLVVFDVFDFDASKREMAVYIYDTASNNVAPQPSFEGIFDRYARPMLPVDNGESLLFFSQEGIYKYRLSDQSWQQIVELSPLFDTHPAWSPAGAHLAYKQGNRLALIDLTSGTASSLHEPEGEVYEFSWSEDGSKIAMLSRSSTGILDIVSIEGELIHSLDVGNTFIYSLCWVPGQEMVSYLERDNWGDPPRLIIEALEEGIRIVDEEARDYAWVSQNKICYYDEPAGEDITRVSFFEISW